jgi:uncharacterized protein (DUF362 family)
MTDVSRRDFLARSAAAAGTLLLPAGGLLAADDAGAAGTEMTIARWAGPKDFSAADLKNIAVKLTEKAIAGLGGLERFVHKGDVVWVKPNIGWDRTPELAGNTNPDVVATIVRLCFEAGAKTVKVGDNTCNPAQKTYVTSGIAEAARAAGAKVLFLDKARFREADIKGEALKKIPVYPEVLECDLVINVPIVKTHSIAKLTMCMKNYMGVIDQRFKLHQNIGPCLADLTRYMKPRLCILDAVRVLTANGPMGGNPADVAVKTTVAAGVDIVALDALGAEILGRKPESITSIVAAEKAGLGKVDYRKLALKEFQVS